MSQVTFDFSGERALVTGAATGIGLAIATAFARAGADVALLDRDAATLETAIAAVNEAGAGRAISVVADLADSAAIAAAAAAVTDQLGGVDILVNNAGVGASKNLVDLSDRELDLNLDINLRATILLTREVLPGMLERGKGAVVNMASQAAKSGFAGITHYSASKAGVLGFTSALAAEVAPAVRVNSVSPGAVLTGMMENNIKNLMDQGKTREQAAANWTDHIPMGRMQTTEDVANAVLFLASDAAKETTGEQFNVSGGQTTH